MTLGVEAATDVEELVVARVLDTDVELEDEVVESEVLVDVVDFLVDVEVVSGGGGGSVGVGFSFVVVGVGFGVGVGVGLGAPAPQVQEP